VNGPHGERAWRVGPVRLAPSAILARGHLGLVVLLAGVAGLLYGLLPRSAGASSGTITECTETQLRADVSAGGSYTFTCSGTIVLTSALLVSKEVSLTATPPNAVTIDGFNPAGGQPKPGTVDRIFTVANGGSLELTGLDLSYGLVSAAPVSTPTQGKIGMVGCLNSRFGYEGGECGSLASAATHYGENGSMPSTPGGNGQNAPAGGSAIGGCMLIEAGGSATLTGDTISACSAQGSSQKWLPGTGPSFGTEGVPGYEQGLGGFGGEGGYGSPGFEGGKRETASGIPGFCEGVFGNAPSAGGIGGGGTHGGNGGNGSEGGAGFGGAIYDAGSLTVSETKFLQDSALGGQGGAGGNGGGGGGGGSGAQGGSEVVEEGKEGGAGGVGFESCHEVSETYYEGGNGTEGSYGGDGGNGGNGGAGEGGAIYARGYLAITASSFSSDTARGGNGGTAGLGGGGGQGGRGGTTGAPRVNNVPAISGGVGGNSGDGGNAGNSGNGGESEGGAVFYATGATGTLPDSATVFEKDNVLAGSICAGGGETATSCDTTGGPAGIPGNGGESTPCPIIDNRYQCPEAPEGAKGQPGAAGTIGHTGHTEGVDVAGAPGSGESPAKKPGGGTGGGSSSGGNSSSGSTGGGGSSGGGSGSNTNTTPPTPHAGTASASGNSISTSVSCTGTPGQSCSVTATITAQETLNGGKVTAVTSRKSKHQKVRHVTVTLGTVTATIAVGSTRKLTVSLSGAGLRLLSSRHLLPVRFTVTSPLAGAAKAGTAPSLLEQTNLTLRAAHPKGKH
jgi:hypothetical protein